MDQPSWSPMSATFQGGRLIVPHRAFIVHATVASDSGGRFRCQSVACWKAWPAARIAGLVEGAADDLEADRNAVGRHAARQGERGMAAHVERARCSAGAQAMVCGVRAAHGRQRGRGHAHRRHQQQVDRRQKQVDLAGDAGARQLQRLSSRPDRPRPRSIRAANSAPYSARRDGKVASCANAASTPHSAQPVQRRLVEVGQHDVDQLRALPLQRRRRAVERALRIGIRADQVVAARRCACPSRRRRSRAA